MGCTWAILNVRSSPYHRKPNYGVEIRGVKVAARSWRKYWQEYERYCFCVTLKGEHLIKFFGHSATNVMAILLLVFYRLKLYVYQQHIFLSCTLRRTSLCIKMYVESVFISHLWICNQRLCKVFFLLEIQITFAL